MQAVVLTLGAGDEIRAEAGANDIQFVGGIKTAIFGGEGLFFASMTGRGRVWIQTLPFSRLADRVLAAGKGDREEAKRDFGGTFSAVGDLIGGDR